MVLIAHLLQEAASRFFSDELPYATFLRSQCPKSQLSSCWLEPAFRLRPQPHVPEESGRFSAVLTSSFVTRFAPKNLHMKPQLPPAQIAAAGEPYTQPSSSSSFLAASATSKADPAWAAYASVWRQVQSVFCHRVVGLTVQVSNSLSPFLSLS
jgi:hypothetical protein